MDMEPTIETLVKALQAMPASSRKRYVRHFLDEISADEKWDAVLTSDESTQALKRLALEIEDEIASGKAGSFYEELDKR